MASRQGQGGCEMKKSDEEYRGFTIKYTPASLMVKATAYGGKHSIFALDTYGYGREDAYQKIRRAIDAYMAGNE